MNKTAIESLILLATLILIIVIFVLSYILLMLIKQQRQPSQEWSKQKIQPRKSKTTHNAHLERKLLAMLNGDRAGAKRLLTGAKQAYPGKPKDWYWERVISDLERDRR